MIVLVQCEFESTLKTVIKFIMGTNVGSEGVKISPKHKFRGEPVPKKQL